MGAIMMKIEPTAEHQWLMQLVGEWTSEMEASMGPDQPPVKHKGGERVRALGQVWLLFEGEAEMPGGGTGLTQMTLGYDPVKKRYVGSFIGSMMTNMWLYDGQLDPGRKILTLDTEGPSMADPTKSAKYRDYIEIIGPDHRTLSSDYLGDDGKWVKFMTAHYRRVK